MLFQIAKTKGYLSLIVISQFLLERENMEIHTNRFNLDRKDTELVLKISNSTGETNLENIINDIGKTV